MRGVGGEGALPFEQLAQPPGGAVEGPRDVVDFADVRGRAAYGEVAIAEAGCGAREFLERSTYPAGEQVGRGAGDEQHTRGERDHQGGAFAELLVDLRLGDRHPDRGAARPVGAQRLGHGEIA